MGLYNFKAQFVPKILAGEKTHTIRALRKDGWVDKPGNKVSLYTGLRRKGAQKLMVATCTKVETITISVRCAIYIAGELLMLDEMEQLARRDGFANFEEMMKFWEGRLPFTGHIIHWRRSGPQG